MQEILPPIGSWRWILTRSHQRAGGAACSLKFLWDIINQTGMHENARVICVQRQGYAHVKLLATTQQALQAFRRKLDAHLFHFLNHSLACRRTPRCTVAHFAVGCEFVELRHGRLLAATHVDSLALQHLHKLVDRCERLWRFTELLKAGRECRRHHVTAVVLGRAQGRAGTQRAHMCTRNAHIAEHRHKRRAMRTWPRRKWRARRSHCHSRTIPHGKSATVIHSTCVAAHAERWRWRW